MGREVRRSRENGNLGIPVACSWVPACAGTTNEDRSAEVDQASASGHSGTPSCRCVKPDSAFFCSHSLTTLSTAASIEGGSSENIAMWQPAWRPASLARSAGRFQGKPRRLRALTGGRARRRRTAGASDTDISAIISRPPSFFGAALLYLSQNNGAVTH
jgi:hypothetical protein